MCNIRHACELTAILSHEAATLASKTASRKYRPMPAPHLIVADALALIRIGKGAARRAVQACNGIERYQGNGIWRGTWTDADELAKDKADAKAIAKGNEIAARYGATVHLGGDPRGHVFRLVRADDKPASFGVSDTAWGIA